MSAWGGIPTLGLGISLLWTEGRKRGVKPGILLSWMTERTAKIAGLQESKGMIRAGMDADFAIFDPEETFAINKAELKFKNKLSPYEGMDLTGRVKETWIRGIMAYDYRRVNLQGMKPAGRLI